MRGQQEINFILEEALLWSTNLDFGQKQRFKAKMSLIDLFLTNIQLFISQDVNCCTGVVWITCVILSAVWTHSDGTHSLQRSHLVSKG